MTDRPILFSAPMILALLAGTKTQTRRVSKIQDWPEAIVRRAPHQKSGVPYAIGDRLWVRETFVFPNGQDEIAWYFATSPWADSVMRWKPSIHMPRRASRLTLHVTEVRVERVQELSEADAIAEGVERLMPHPHALEAWTDYVDFNIQQPSAKGSYRTLWDSINGEGAWALNPYVVAVTFEVEEANITQARATA